MSIIVERVSFFGDSHRQAFRQADNLLYLHRNLGQFNPMHDDEHYIQDFQQMRLLHPHKTLYYIYSDFEEWDYREQSYDYCQDIVLIGLADDVQQAVAQYNLETSQQSSQRFQRYRDIIQQLTSLYHTIPHQLRPIYTELLSLHHRYSRLNDARTPDYTLATSTAHLQELESGLQTLLNSL